MNSELTPGLRVLVIDGDSGARAELRRGLEACGCEALEAAAAGPGLELFRARRPDLVLVDTRALETLAAVRREAPETPVLVMAGPGETAAVGEALRLGAWDWLPKPAPDPAILPAAIARGLERARLIAENRRNRQALEEMAGGRLQALLDSEAMFSAFLECSSVYIFFKDETGRSLRLSRNYEQMLGLPIQDAQGKTMFDLFPPELARSMTEDDLRVLREGRWVNVVEELNGQIYETSKFPIFIDGRPQMLAGFTLNATERKRTEAELRESVERFRTLAEEMPLGLSVIDAGGRYEYVNASFVSMTGYTLEDTPTGREWFARAFPDAAERRAAINTWKTDLENAPEGEARPREYRVMCKDGNQKDILFRPVTISQGRQFVLYEDVTERRRAEDKLRASEERYRTVVENSMIGVCVTGERGLYEYVNPRFCDLSGYAAEELIGQHFSRIAPSEQTAQAWQSAYAQSIQRRQAFPGEYAIRRKDGQVVDVRVDANYVTGMDGAVRQISFFLDVTERKRADEALRASEAALQKAQAVAHLGSWAWHIQANRLEWSDEMYRIFGVEKDAGAPDLADVIARAIHPDDREAVERSNQSVIQEKRPVPLEYRVVRPDGTVRIVWAEAGELALDDNGNPGLLTGIMLDITERKQVEAQLRRALLEKETLLRELYHRTKNNMNVIGAMLSLRAEHSPDEDTRRTLRDIGDKIRSMALVHQKLYQSQDLSNVNLQEYIPELAALLVRSHAVSPDRVSLVMDVEPVSVPVDIAIPCGLILNELFVNAFRHAFPGGRQGQIRLAISRMEGDEIEIAFSDDGVGAPPDFDFKTQPTLGLQIIWAIVVHQLHGQAHFESGPGVRCHIRFSSTGYSERV